MVVGEFSNDRYVWSDDLIINKNCVQNSKNMSISKNKAAMTKMASMNAKGIRNREAFLSKLTNPKGLVSAKTCAEKVLADAEIQVDRAIALLSLRKREIAEWRLEQLAQEERRRPELKGLESPTHIAIWERLVDKGSLAFLVDEDSELDEDGENLLTAAQPAWLSALLANKNIPFNVSVEVCCVEFKYMFTTDGLKDIETVSLIFTDDHYWQQGIETLNTGTLFAVTPQDKWSKTLRSMLADANPDASKLVGEHFGFDYLPAQWVVVVKMVCDRFPTPTTQGLA